MRLDPLPKQLRQIFKLYPSKLLINIFYFFTCFLHFILHRDNKVLQTAKKEDTTMEKSEAYI